MSDLKKYLKKQLKNSEFKNEWISLQPEMELIDAIVKARAKKKNNSSKSCKNHRN